VSDFNYAYIFIILAVAYALQLLLTGWQAKRFFRRLKELRRDGTLSIGLSGGKWSGRIYAVLVVDDDMNIIHAGELSGMTIFSQLKLVDGLVGLNARELLDETRDFPVKKKPLTAFRNAAKEFFNEVGEPKADLQQQDALP
jgi:glucitol operon activator protein